MKRRKYLVWLLGAAILVLTACTTPSDLTPPPGDPALAGPTDRESDPAPVENPQGETQSVEPSLMRTPRQQLEASDPSTVVLASGQPQLVEFFAFW